jgi:diphthamide biosynthesis enzyme Dph1/Dph2-like protein
MKITLLPKRFSFREIPPQYLHLGVPQPRMVFVSTIQFVASLQSAARELKEKHGFSFITVPQAKPLSPGEILGCTSPIIKDADMLIYLGKHAILIMSN